MSHHQPTPNGRKASSLGVLAKNFMDQLPEEPADGESWEFSISELTDHFQTRKGTIYTLLLTLESILVISKIGREIYRWNGFGFLAKTMAFLKQIAEKLKTGDKLQRHKKTAERKLLTETAEKLGALRETQIPALADTFLSDFMDFDHEEELILPDYPANDDDETNISIDAENGKEASTSTSGEMKYRHSELCQRLLMIFLVADQKIWTLKHCAKVIFDNSIENGSETRRLYDIANVFSAMRRPLLNIVRHQTGHGLVKAYEYCGPDLSSVELSEEDIHNLPHYRINKGLYSWGKAAFDIPERPSNLSGLQTVRVGFDEYGRMAPVKENSLLFLNALAIRNFKAPFTTDQILMIESKRSRFSILSEEEVEGVNEIEGISLHSKLAFAILPDQESFEEVFDSKKEK